MHKLSQNQHEHDEVLELLPWHLNNTLNAAESQRVLAHLNQCAACQQEAELLTTALDAANAYAPTTGIADDRFDTVMARIERAEAEENPTHAGLRGKLGSWWQNLGANMEFNLGWGAAVTAGLLVAVIGFQFLPTDDARYETVTTTPTGNESPLALRVQFKEATTRAAAKLLLESSGAEFTLEQEDAINYIVSLPDDAPVTALNTLLQALSTEAKIATVEVALDSDK